MKNKKFILLYYLTIVVFFLTNIISTIIIYFTTKNIKLSLITLFLMAISTLCVLIYLAMIRKELIGFTDGICKLLEEMLNSKLSDRNLLGEETLFDKIQSQLLKLYEVLSETRDKVKEEQKLLKELVSDISHQIKTPMTNLKVINSILLDSTLTKEEHYKYIKESEGQLNKLEFLMDSMIKTSRLETGAIVLNKKNDYIYNTIAAALGSIYLKAEEKKINIEFNCTEKLMIPHDAKWTTEAIFNILDNAVKYTTKNGKVKINVEEWELYIKIDVIDSGIGILEREQAEIFKRFYRGLKVYDIDGVGLGLYLAREIISKQGGYIIVKSIVNRGSIFSIFLPKK